MRAIVAKTCKIFFSLPVRNVGCGYLIEVRKFNFLVKVRKLIMKCLCQK
jgi:hypothetical protein